MDEAERVAYGQKIKAMRIAAGLTQTDLSTMCKLEGKSGTNTVQHWEHGRRLPGIDNLRDLAIALRVPLDQVVP